MKIAVIGSGLMGQAIVYDLCRAENVDKIGVYDFDSDLAEEVARKFGNEKTITGQIDAGNEEQVVEVLRDYNACISAVTFKYNPGLTRAAIKTGIHFFDLGGNNDVVRLQFEMHDEAKAADIIVIPDCGLAPGLVSILAAAGVKEFDKVSSLKIRVGGLPQNPRPPLNYQMVFSSEGLINEYWEPVIILEEGKKKIVAPMTGLEELEFDGIGTLEAFYTSGGTSTLPNTYKDKIDFLDYKTIRYKGHCQTFKPMLEIGLGSKSAVKVDGQNVEPREVLKKVLEKNLAFNDPDLVLVKLIFEGTKDDQPKKMVYEIIDRQDTRTGLTSMMRTTAFPVSIIAWMACSGRIEHRGVVPQEIAVDPAFFIAQLKKRNINISIKNG